MPSFTWAPAASRYRDVRGRFVPTERVRASLDTVLDGASERMRLLTRQVAAGELSVAEWQTRFMAEAKQAHVAAGVAMRGGTQQMSQADYGAIGQRVRGEYAYVRRFAADLAAGTMTPAQAEARAELYGHAARMTGRAMEGRLARQRGAVEERRILAVADHCATCLSEAARGWQPIGTLRPIGDTECRSNDRCHLEYRTAPESEVLAA